MSYNITNWRTKKLDNLAIPLLSLYIPERKDWHPNLPIITNVNTMEVELHHAEQVIKGNLVAGLLYVTEIAICGEGSGTFFSWILVPALKQSSGKMSASLVWEGGDSLSKIKVVEGVVTEKIK